MIEPSLEEFKRQATQRRVISVYARLLADDVTAVAMYQQLCQQRVGTYLFESVSQGTWSRWSFAGVNCATTLICRNGEISWHGQVLEGIPKKGKPIELLGQLLSDLHSPRDENLPPFSSGMVGYIGYDMVREYEDIAQTNLDDIGLPDMVMMLASDLAVLDHHNQELWLIANAINFDGSPDRVEQAYFDAVERVKAMVAQITKPRPSLIAECKPADKPVIVRKRSTQQFYEMVEKAKKHIRAGDIFQVVPSQRFEINTTADALAIYRQLRRTNPSPYLYLLRLADQDNKPFEIIGSSPEALVTVKNGVVTTRPIAGTRPRGKTPLADRQLEQELLADEKERSEHLMLVDLGRNDLGRVCVPGSVELTEFMQVHRYSHVMHLEASVVGKLDPNESALEATMACLPAGTLSGAPKVRAMQLIEELETTRRGPYGGVIGYFDFAGDSDAAIAIRTAIVRDGRAYVQSGAGIVADSVAENEDIETQNKAAAVLNAIAQASNSQVIKDPNLLDRN